MDRQKRQRLLLAGIILAGLSSSLILWPRATGLLTPVMMVEHRAELTLAWPVQYGRASLLRWRTLAHAGGTTTARHAELPTDTLPPFTAWQAQPVADRWARYTSPAWHDVRLLTRLSGGLVVGFILVLAGRLAGWPTLRGIWFVAALVLTQHPGRPGTRACYALCEVAVLSLLTIRRRTCPDGSTATPTLPERCA